MKRKNKGYLKHFKELYNLIPKIQEITKNCIQKERDNLPHDINRITEERKFLEHFFNLIQRKWTLDVIHILNILGEVHYNEIKRVLKGISSRILTDRLKMLEKKGLVIRIVHDTRPVHISYKLTEYGEGFILLLIPLVSYFLLHDK
ncbi:MAG: winged helix-turn-helix transcriptional regulator [Candidatus Hermodarchaeota archaeon]